MCGIAGFLTTHYAADTHESVLRSMTDSLTHRGPDSSGIWINGQNGVGLGHRRLAIIDLSPAGAQPMTSRNGDMVIAFNGEIYNFIEIRGELKALGHTFRGDSDTEVLLAAIAQWGVEAAIHRCIGMFALALWDRSTQTLTLVRDRLGIKPLYYGWAANDFIFGSELKALRQHPGFNTAVDRNALSTFFRHNYIPGEASIYQNVRKLRPGHILSIRAGEEPKVKQYWSAADQWSHGEQSMFSGGANEAVHALESLLTDSISKRLVADVPIGCFLSGGIDSTLVTALMQSISSDPIHTFTIGFEDPKYNEADTAREIAAHLGTKHTELYVTQDEMKATLPELAKCWDEPFADPSQIPTYCLSHFTRKHVTVSLSGDGGDELFCGYDRYFITNKLWKTLHLIPAPLRKLMASAGKKLPIEFYNLLGSYGSKAHWRLDGLSSDTPEALYRFLLSHNKKPDKFVRNGKESSTPYSSPVLCHDNFHQMALSDILAYLPDDILTKVDRASMAASLEARVPLLDHRVVEFAGQLPTSLKVRDGKGKWILREILSKHVPESLTNRPKMGFGVPLATWMREDMREWCESLLDERLIREEGILDADMVSTMWREFLAGSSHWHFYLWDILMFQAWSEEWL